MYKLLRWGSRGLGHREVSVRIVKACFRKVGREGRGRPAEGAEWDRLLDRDCLLAGDFNAHSPRWNPRRERKRDHFFLENMIGIHELVVLNDGLTTRPGPNEEGRFGYRFGPRL